MAFLQAMNKKDSFIKLKVQCYIDLHVLVKKCSGLSYLLMIFRVLLYDITISFKKMAAILDLYFSQILCTNWQHRLIYHACYVNMHDSE